MSKSCTKKDYDAGICVVKDHSDHVPSLLFVTIVSTFLGLLASMFLVTALSTYLQSINSSVFSNVSLMAALGIMFLCLSVTVSYLIKRAMDHVHRQRACKK